MQCNAKSDTLPETNGLPLKIGVWETTFILGRPIFRGVLVSFREGNLPNIQTTTCSKDYHKCRLNGYPDLACQNYNNCYNHGNQSWEPKGTPRMPPPPKK